jgi:hypothetical protein
MAHQIQWMVGALPSDDGWYIVAKRGCSSPSLMRFSNKCHETWERVIAWYGPIVISMNEVKGITC